MADFAGKPRRLRTKFKVGNPAECDEGLIYFHNVQHNFSFI